MANEKLIAELEQVLRGELMTVRISDIIAALRQQDEDAEIGRALREACDADTTIRVEGGKFRAVVLREALRSIAQIVPFDDSQHKIDAEVGRVLREFYASEDFLALENLWNGNWIIATGFLSEKLFWDDVQHPSLLEALRAASVAVSGGGEV